jgi:hypothetical protein
VKQKYELYLEHTVNLRLGNAFYCRHSVSHKIFQNIRGTEEDDDDNDN